ncbi:hypothetical protein, partial [Rhodovulum adriaticum]|uniref:hypothetical protein n=1 Tax=Rhodovulum adriaticum TaxID=35804 RepID=UPI001A923710
RANLTRRRPPNPSLNVRTFKPQRPAGPSRQRLSAAGEGVFTDTDQDAQELFSRNMTFAQIFT